MATTTKVCLASTMDVVMHKNYISGGSGECPFLMRGGGGHITHCDFYNADCVLMPAYK